jgi:predicted lipid-binding transport protein (Tim44 family)
MRISFDPGRPRSLAGRIAGALLGAILFGAALMFSVLFFAFLALLALAFWAYFRWKTRALRRAMREQARAPGSSPNHAGRGKSVVIEGEAVRVE